MSDSIKDCKDEKRQIEKQIAGILVNFCTKYGIILHRITTVQKPNYQKGETVWTGEIELSIIF